MSEYAVKVTYSGPILFLSSGQWTHTLTSLKERLPLRNLHWRSVSRPSVRSVQELDVDLVSLDVVRDEPSSQIPATLLERPLLNIYFVTCEDADAYKNSVRKQIRDWHTIVTQRKNQEWLICLVIRPDAEGTTKRLFQRGTLLDKIRADFNVPKRERCVQLAWSVGSEDPAAWTDLISKMKEGLVSSFDANIIQREEEVKRSEVQRQMPGWNFCTFFILKESLATSFDGMNLTEDALIQYDELEASFFQVLKEKNLSWFGQLGGTAPNDDSAPLLSVTKKPYRDLILSNTITVFDFRSYLLARQCFLLARLGQIAEAAIKAERFITSFARTLQENKKDLSDFFLESWMYSAAIGVVNQCDAWADAASIEPPAMASLNAAKAELLDLARSQLDKIGIRRGYLPCIHPFSMSLPLASNIEPPENPPSEPVDARISSPDLIEALRGRDEFDRLYITTTNRCIQTYNSCNRRRFALRLHATLAAVDNCRQRYPSAHAVFASLPGHYLAQRWSSLEGLVLSKSMGCYPALNRPRDKEWVNQAVAFLRAFVIESGNQDVKIEDSREPSFASMFGEQKKDFVLELVRGIGELTSLENDHVALAHPAFSLRVDTDKARIAETEDGSLIDLTIVNLLPVEVTTNSISVILAGGDEELHFSSPETVILSRGQTSLSLSCPTPCSGLFNVESSSIRVGKVIFQYTSSTASQKAQKHEKESKKSNQRSQVVRIPHDPDAFDVQLSFPDNVSLDATPHLMFSIHTGRNHVAEGTVRLRNLTNEVVFDIGQANTCQDTHADGIQFTEDCILLRDVPPGTVFRIDVPYSGVRLDIIKVLVSVEYMTSASNGVRRRFTRLRQVSTALPLAVNVQDYFRGTKLFSRFSIRCATQERLYLLDATLEPRSPTSKLKISRCRRPGTVAEPIVPLRPIYYLFMVDSASREDSEPETLVLKLQYRPLKEEIESRVTDAIKMVDEQHPDMIVDKALTWSTLVERLESGDRWQELLRPRGSSAFRQDVIAEFSTRFSVEEIGQVSAGLSKVIEVLQRQAGPRADGTGRCRTLAIPVDLPAVNILNAAHLTIPAASTKAVFSGQPMEAVLSISTSFHWGSRPPPGNGYLLRFDIDPDATGNWLISGQRRGEYLAKDQTTYETKVTLVPLRDGALLLPKVIVAPFSDDVEGHDGIEPSCETHQVHAAQRINVLPRSARSTYIVTLA